MRWMPVKEGSRDRRRPERRRDEIMRALSERLPDLDLPKIDRPKVDLPDIDLPRVDIRRAMEEAAIRAGVRERRRSRWPIVAALLIAGIVGLVAVLRRPAVRAQVEETARRTRVRIEQMRLERETADLSMEEIEHAVGEGNGTGARPDPVAVGPGLDLEGSVADGDGAVSAALDESPALQETGAPT